MDLKLANIAIICCCFFLSIGCGARGTDYTSDLKDLQIRPTVFGGHWAAGQRDPTPIGDLGPIEKVIDLRGFVPISYASNSRFTLTETSTTLRWFKVPTKTAMFLLYDGSIHIDQLPMDNPMPTTDRNFKKTQFLQESKASGADARWCLVAYKEAQNPNSVFPRLVGDFDSAEPILVFFTKDDAFIVISVKYSSFNMPGNGQFLLALEFSRAFKEYRAVYPLYTTTLWTHALGEEFIAAAPTLTKVALAVFAHQGE